MKNCDLLIIGGGIAGLTAACRAAEQNQKVQILTYGVGTYSIGGGTIDVLGYDAQGKPFDTPLQGLTQVAPVHPYAKIGADAVREALAWLKKITEQTNYAYTGDLDSMQWVPTAAGTFKPTCLVPPTMCTASLRQAKKVIVLGFAHFKDFYPKLVADNLQKIYGRRKTVEAISLSIDAIHKNTLTALDIARWLDTEEGIAAFIRQAQPLIPVGAAVILPPVLGTRADCGVLNKLEQALKVNFTETASLPPSVAGLRLGNLLSQYAKRLGVTFIENTKISGANLVNAQCESVYSENGNRRRTYAAETFILATGGLYGGGLLANGEGVTEPIFQLPVQTPPDVLAWSNDQLLAAQAQPFAQFGIAVNGRLEPVDIAGKTLLTNVKIIGRNLQGYDFSFEKSGNGVAVASGYQSASDKSASKNEEDCP